MVALNKPVVETKWWWVSVCKNGKFFGCFVVRGDGDKSRETAEGLVIKLAMMAEGSDGVYDLQGHRLEPGYTPKAMYVDRLITRTEAESIDAAGPAEFYEDYEETDED